MPRFTAPVAVHLFLCQADSVLLLRRFNTGYEDGNWSVPAGHLDGDETVIAAAIREAQEEIGVQIEPGALRPVGVMHRRTAHDERIDFFVAATTWQGEVRNCEPHKCDALEWHKLDDLPANVIPYIRRALQNLRAERWFDEFGF
jgi:8-oxo-dGTP diphosphatase